MTASINPDDYSHTPKDTDPRDPQGFTYEDPNTQPTEPESTYVPEREFVLMPLFRRIGELLGIRRGEEPEYIYEATQEAPPSQVNSAHEDANPVPESHAQPVLESRFVEAGEPIHESIQEPAKPEPEFVSEVAPVASEPITSADHLALQTSSFPEPEEAEVVPTRFEEPSFAIEHLPTAQSKPLEAATPAVSMQNFEQPEYEPAAEIHASQTLPTLPEVAAARSTSLAPSAERRPAPRRKDEIDEAIAILREAGSKVSTAISQAVEWLSEKEEELVREAKRSLAPAPKTRRVQAVTAIPRVTSAPPSQAALSTEPIAAPTEPVTADESSAVPTLEPLQFPALQREISWTGNVAPARPVERSGPKTQQPIQTTYSVKQRPALVPRRPKVPFWKRIDWAAEFTPKRVAVLGGVIMAMLIVAGVTFARRPASEVLPPQPHAIQPGGVTVTTHPNPPAAAQPTQQSRKATPPARRAVKAAPVRTQPSRAASSEEPDVVTHYYKQKPSPSKSATVAGVKHYSDVE